MSPVVMNTVTATTLPTPAGAASMKIVSRHVVVARWSGRTANSLVGKINWMAAITPGATGGGSSQTSHARSLPAGTSPGLARTASSVMPMRHLPEAWRLTFVSLMLSRHFR
ncbi:MAG: hypothetical protein M0Z34_06705 [Nitrospiraceae bacterium]|nr:hypothetical protein [Nitrospiraceae bacterium]